MKEVGPRDSCASRAVVCGEAGILPTRLVMNLTPSPVNPHLRPLHPSPPQDVPPTSLLYETAKKKFVAVCKLLLEMGADIEEWCSGVRVDGGEASP